MVRYLTTAKEMKAYHREQVARKIALRDMKKSNKRRSKKNA